MKVFEKEVRRVGKRKKGGGETGERGGGVLERGARAGSLFMSQRHNFVDEAPVDKN